MTGPPLKTHVWKDVLHGSKHSSDLAGVGIQALKSKVHFSCSIQNGFPFMNGKKFVCITLTVELYIYKKKLKSHNESEFLWGGIPV